MKEIYNKILIDIEFIDREDVITASASLDDTDHDNGYIDWGDLE